MRNFKPFLFLLINVAVTICVLLCLGCGPTIDSAKIYNSQGLAKVEMGQYEDAIADFDTAVQKKPDFAEAYYNRGYARAKLLEYKIANDYYDVVTITKLTSYAAKDFETALELAEQTGDTQLKRIVMTYLNSLKTSEPDKILRVGDELPPFTSNDVVSMVYTLWSGKLITGFQKNGWIELKNGTRYICVSPGGCEIANFTITKGTIEVYHRTYAK